MASSVSANTLAPAEARTNLALGKEVFFAPRPNYAPTAKGKTDATDLTDGKISTKVQVWDGVDLTDGETSSSGQMWTDPLAVGWSYAGRVNFAVDLGKQCEIDEISIRFAQQWLNFNVTGWIEALVSDDGVHYTKVAQRSRWTDKDFYQGADSVTNNANATAYLWKFSNLKNVRGRYIGLRVSTNKLLVADEFSVFGKETNTTANPSPAAQSGFSVTQPQPYFHKPVLLIPTNITAPQSMGIVTGALETMKGNLEVELDLPAGLVLDAPSQGITQKSLSDGGTRYLFNRTNPSADRAFARLYLRAPNSPDHQEGNIRWRYRFGDWNSGELTIPYRTVTVPTTPTPRRLDTIAFGCWKISDTAAWPDALKTFKHVGLNALSLYATSGSPAWMPQDRNAPEWKLLDDARSQGFKVFGIDPTFMVMKRAGDKATGKEITCQYADGTNSKYVCPSYRGKFYKAEIERYAKQIAAAKPDFTMQDIELWGSGYGGTKLVEKCSRCATDFKTSGLKSWEEWWQAKGSQMWKDALTAARQELKAQGANSNFLTAGYHFEVGKAYHNAFNFDRLYPEDIQLANPRHYASYYPRDLLFIAEMVRENRKHLPRSDVWQLLSPGDAGPIPGDAFTWSILESYCNGARGVLFWSQRHWDAEYVIAYSNAIRAITPVEDIIMDGELIGDTAQVTTPGHISGMHHNNKMVLLVSDYQSAGNGTLELKLQLKTASQIRDLQSGKIVENSLPAGLQTIRVPLNGAAARLLEVTPIR